MEATSKNFSAFWRRIVAIWLQPIQILLNLRTKKTLLLWLSVFPLVGLVTYYFLPVTNALQLKLKLILVGTLLGVDFVVLIAFWLLFLILNVGLQFSAANAALLPSLKRHLQWALAIPVGIVAVSLGVVFGLANASFSVGMQAWFISLFGIIVYMVSTREKKNLLLFIAAVQLPLLTMAFKDVLPWESIKSIARPAVLIVGGAGLFLFVLRWLFCRGEHLFSRVGYLLAHQKMSMDNAAWNLVGFQKIRDFLYLRILERQISESTGRNAKPSKLVAQSLGGQLHWIAAFVPLVGGALAISLVSILVRKVAANTVSPMVYVIGFFTAMMIAKYLGSQKILYQSHAAISLVLLAAKAPCPRQQTKIIVRYVLLQYAITWLAAVAVLTNAVSLLLFDPLTVRFFYLAAACMLIPLVWLTKNYSKATSVNDNQLAAVCGVVVLSFAIAAAVMFFVRIPVLLLSGGIAGLTLAGLYWRWKQILRVGVMFPAGRAV